MNGRLESVSLRSFWVEKSFLKAPLRFAFEGVVNQLEPCFLKQLQEFLEEIGQALTKSCRDSDWLLGHLLSSRFWSAGNDEREQTVNQLLTEMDGFESNKAGLVA